MSVPPSATLIDTHAHLQDPAFDDDREAVLDAAREAGLVAMICVGYDLESSRLAVDLASRHDDVFAAVGIHPNSCGATSEGDWAELCDLAREPRVVGIGETGLDNYRHYTRPDVQERWFEHHLDLATELSLPVIIHNRDASPRLRELLSLRSWPPESERPAGVLHCFSADDETLATCLGLGFFISFAGPLTYKNAQGLRALAAKVPADRLVVETDCPYLPPQQYRGQRNEPAFVRYTAAQLAQVRAEQYSELAERTSQAAARLFGLHTLSPGERRRIDHHQLTV